MCIAVNAAHGKNGLIQEHDGTEFPIGFLSHTFSETQKSGVQLNKRPMEFIMLSPNRITISHV